MRAFVSAVEGQLSPLATPPLALIQIQALQVLLASTSNLTNVCRGIRTIDTELPYPFS
jgi:hypothetical protein